MGSSANGTEKIFSVKKQDPVFVRPAAKTPGGDYFLSNLDQIMTYKFDFVLTYKNGSIETMKESLAEVLVEYYPFAGRLTLTSDMKMMVRCTGEGVRFLEASSDIELEELGDVSVLDPLRCKKLVYCVNVANFVDVPPLTVQVTLFTCGGIALGISYNHVFADGLALAEFLNCWGETGKKVPLSVHPFLDRSILSPRQPPTVQFPHHEFLDMKYTCIPSNHADPHVYKSILFDQQMLKQLKELSKDKQSNSNPTSFEVILALAWMLRTKSLRFEAQETVKLLIAVDIRSKCKPPLPKGYFGNGIAWASAVSKAGEMINKPFSYVVKMVRDAIYLVTEDYLKSSIDHYELTRAGLDFRNTCYATKWSNLGYDVDFGWGLPTQLGPASLMDNLMVVNSQRNGSKNTVLNLGLPAFAMEHFEELMDFKSIMKEICINIIISTKL